MSEPGPGSGDDTATAPLSVVASVLAEAQALGYLGPGPIGPQVEHALAFRALLGQPRRAVDLGSGGGLPGLVLAALAPDTEWVLVDAGRRRTEFLADAASRLGLATVTVVWRRAEDLGRDPGHRDRYDAVVARSFGAPAVTAECASPLLRPGGVLVVSEPPEGREARWPADGLARLGLTTAGTLERPALASFSKAGPTPEQFPRRVGIPSKRPLWGGST
jgi:16S rRNA (guanine527-N7)-methyltransferase